MLAESGESGSKASNFDAIAYVHASENPSFRLLEEKTVPNLVDKFWHGVNEFVEGATLIWQSINLDGEDLHEDALHRFEECKKFRNYRGGSMSAKAIEIEHEKNRDKVTAIGEEEGASNERCGSCLAKPCKCVMPSYYLSSKTI